MRVIAGKARRLPLKTIEGMETRPTTDRIKETLFNMLQEDISGSFVLDLFSGSGGIGIEALSRGAKVAYFVENNKKAAACIRDNLKFTKLEKDAIVMECDFLTALSRLEGKDVAFDLIFLDPPYGKGYEKQVLQYLSQSKLAKEETLIVIETSIKTELKENKDMEQMGFLIEKEIRYKTNKHIFCRKKEQEIEESEKYESSNLSWQF